MSKFEQVDYTSIQNGDFELPEEVKKQAEENDKKANEINNAYRKDDLFETPEMKEVEKNEEDFGIAIPQESEPTYSNELTHKGYGGEMYTDDEWDSPAIIGGPTRKEIEGWKSKFNGNVYFLSFDTGIHIFRSLTRSEYREIIRSSKLTSLDREEAIASKCVLFPYDFSIESMDDKNAGEPSLLSETIMEKSGFVAKTGAIKL